MRPDPGCYVSTTVERGERRAVQIAGGLSEATAVLLYSIDRLAIGGTAVVVEPLTGDDYRYRGLRLLIRTLDHYLLLPAGWRKGADNVFVIEAEDSIRVDLKI